MGKKSFSAAERWAIFTVHGDKCYLCNCPIDLVTMEVDHIIPESLETEPERFAKIRVDFGLPEDFNLNSYENWLPSCRKCNGDKSSTVLEMVPIIQLQLQRASGKADRCREAEAKTESNKALGKALNTLMREGERRGISKEVLEPVLAAFMEVLEDSTLNDKFSEPSGDVMIAFKEKFSGRAPYTRVFRFRISPTLTQKFTATYG